MKQHGQHTSGDTTASRTPERRSRLRALLPGFLTVGLGAVLVNVGCATGEDIGEGPFDSGGLSFPSGGAEGSGASSGAGGYASGQGGFQVVTGGSTSSGGTGSGGGSTGSGGMGGATNAGGSTAGATSTGGASGGAGGKSTGGTSSGGAKSTGGTSSGGAKSSGGASSGGASAGGAPACTDTDGDGACDDAEDGDGDDWTDKAVFNGVHVIQGGQCGASGDCERIDTPAEISSCLNNPDEEKDQYAGWDWNNQDDGICAAGYGWAPRWSECHDDWAARWQGCIHLTGNGPHCFAIDGGTDEACTTLFFDGATSSNARSGGGVQCVTAAPGNYPILWAYTMDGGSSAGVHVRYCDAAGGTECTPSQAIPASMLRTSCP